MRFLAVVTLMAITVVSALGAPRSTAPLPPSAVLFDGDYSFRTVGITFSTPVMVPVDGAWLAGTAVWNHTSFPYWDCSHSYRGVLAPNNNDYSPLFIAGWDANSICSNQFPVFGCLNCGIDWGGQKAFPGFYMTTNNTPGFIAPGTGAVTLSSNNSGGQSDLLTLHVEQINRDAMVNLTMYQSLDESDPTPASSTEIADRYFIAEGADRVPVVPVFHYGVDAQGSDRQFPAGPDVTYVAAWDRGTPTSTPEIAFAQQGLHGHTILAVPIPKLATGSHTFTVTATLASGRTFTTPSMTVFVYAKSIYVTVNAAFDPRNPRDDLPNFIPGSDLNGVDLDLRSGPQSVQLNILISRGSSGTFDVHLRDVTHYPGVAMNFPIGAPNPDPDPDIDFGSGIVDLMAVPIPHGGSPKVVRLPLYIHDYAAAATIEATIPHRRTTFVTRRRIPIDNGNGLPAAGWYADDGSHVSTASLRAGEDIDISPPLNVTVLGDGLSNSEEYRGFFVGTRHIRTNPEVKDLFIDADADILSTMLATNVIESLPAPRRIHYIDSNQDQGIDIPGRATRMRPSIDPNRAGVPGATGQRAIRIIYQADSPPALNDALLNQDFPVWMTGFFGLTMPNAYTNYDILNRQPAGTVAQLRSPDDVQFVEVYPRSFENTGIHVATFANSSQFYDRQGNSVPNCGADPCDIWDITDQIILPRAHFLQNDPDIAQWYELYTVLDSTLMGPSSFYTKQSQSCDGTLQLRGGLSTADVQRLRSADVGHEVGHALGVPHNLTDCRDLMYDNQSRTNRRTMFDFVPVPTSYSFTATQQMQLRNP